MLVKTIPLLLAASCLVACSANPTHFKGAVVADSLTTWVGLNKDGVRELNPLFKDRDAATVAIGSALLTVAMQKAVRYTLPKRDCEYFTRWITSGKFGAAANNMGVIADSGDVAPFAGVGVGLLAYNKLPADSGECG